MLFRSSLKLLQVTMFTLEEISEFDSETVGDNFNGDTKPMEEYLDTFETSLQSKTPYSDVTKVFFSKL